MPIEEPPSKESPIKEVQESSPSLDIPTEPPPTDEKLDKDENEMEPTLSDSEPTVRLTHWVFSHSMEFHHSK